MNGNPVGLFTAFSTFPAQNRIAIRAAKPRTPLRAVVAIIIRGTTAEALGISSAVDQQSARIHRQPTLTIEVNQRILPIWQAPSAPVGFQKVSFDTTSDLKAARIALTEERVDSGHDANKERQALRAPSSTILKISKNFRRASVRRCVH